MLHEDFEFFLDNVLEKGGKAILGEIRHRKDGDWIKHIEGWVHLHSKTGKYSIWNNNEKHEAKEHHIEFHKKTIGQKDGDGNVKPENKSNEKVISAPKGVEKKPEVKKKEKEPVDLGEDIHKAGKFDFNDWVKHYEKSTYGSSLRERSPERYEKFINYAKKGDGKSISSYFGLSYAGALGNDYPPVVKEKARQKAVKQKNANKREEITTKGAGDYGFDLDSDDFDFNKAFEIEDKVVQNAVIGEWAERRKKRLGGEVNFYLSFTNEIRNVFKKCSKLNINVNGAPNDFYKDALKQLTPEEFKVAIEFRGKLKLGKSFSGDWNKENDIPTLRNLENYANYLPRGHFINNFALSRLSKHDTNAATYAHYGANEISFSRDLTNKGQISGNLSNPKEFEHVFVHELGHAVSVKFRKNKKNDYDDFGVMMGWNRNDIDKKPLYNEQRNRLLSKVARDSHKIDLVSDYAGASVEECFAEYYAMYTINKKVIDDYITKPNMQIPPLLKDGRNMMVPSQVKAQVHVFEFLRDRVFSSKMIKSILNQGDDILEKALRHTGHLQLVRYIDKNGKQTQHWINPNKPEGENHDIRLGIPVKFEHKGTIHEGIVKRVAKNGEYGIEHPSLGLIHKEPQQIEEIPSEDMLNKVEKENAEKKEEPKVEEKAKSLAQVNKLIHTKYPLLNLTRGDGYHYLTSEDNDMANKLAMLYTTSIYVNSIKSQTPSRWLEDVESVLGDEQGGGGEKFGNPVFPKFKVTNNLPSKADGGVIKLIQQETEKPIMSAYKKKSTGYQAIDDIIEQVKPFQLELAEQTRKKLEEEGEIVTDDEMELIKFGYIVDLVKSLGNYIKKGDTVRNIHFDKHRGGAIAIMCTIVRDDTDNFFKTEMIIAHGPIQRRHYRYIVDTKLKSLNANEPFAKIDKEFKNLTKIQKLKHELNQNIKIKSNREKVLAETEKKAKLSDADIEKIIRQEDPDRAKSLDTTWEEIIERGADKNFNYKKSEFLNKQSEWLKSTINSWRNINANVRNEKDRVQSSQKEIDKLNKKIQELSSTDDLEKALRSTSHLQLVSYVDHNGKRNQHWIDPNKANEKDIEIGESVRFFNKGISSEGIVKRVTKNGLYGVEINGELIHKEPNQIKVQ